MIPKPGSASELCEEPLNYICLSPTSARSRENLWWVGMWIHVLASSSGDSNVARLANSRRTCCWEPPIYFDFHSVPRIVPIAIQLFLKRFKQWKNKMPTVWHEGAIIFSLQNKCSSSPSMSRFSVTELHCYFSIKLRFSEITENFARSLLNSNQCCVNHKCNSN